MRIKVITERQELHLGTKEADSAGTGLAGDGNSCLRNRKFFDGHSQASFIEGAQIFKIVWELCNEGFFEVVCYTN